MELLQQYIEGLNTIIKAGVDVRADRVLDGLATLRSVPVIKVEIDVEAKDLRITYRHRSSSQDKTGHIPASMDFLIAYNDLANDLRAEGWQ